MNLNSLPQNLAGSYDVLVVGATPAGVACALRAAREGVSVLLAEASSHVGGMWVCGVQVFDTRYAGHRCPVLSEFVARIESYYRATRGEGSPDHALARFGDPSRHGERPRFEPHVAEKVLREMLADCPGVRLALGLRLESVQKDGVTLREVVFRTAAPADDPIRVTADIFVDATYEANLASLAGAAFRVGREGRDEFGEPHAGAHFTTIDPIGDVGHSIARRLNLHYFNRTSRQVFSGSTGQGDRAVQAYSARLVLTNRAENRQNIIRPAGYTRDRYLGILDRDPDAHTRAYPLSSHFLHGSIEDYRFAVNIPGGKMDWLGANLVGGNHDYPLASPARRAELYRQHVAHSLGLLHFLQQDLAVPESLRRHACEWGLARDEYSDNANIPHAIYVREAYRLVGGHVFTEHDATLHPLHGRAPIHSDSIAFTEWPMDSHDCNPSRKPGSLNDGEFILAEQTVPAQIPFRCLQTDRVDNLLVPVAMSSSHVGWGTLRLEPVFVHTGEVAGFAAAMCLRQGVVPAQLNVPILQAGLLRRRIAISYFSDLDLSRDDLDATAIQLLSVHGFFGSYESDGESLIGPASVQAWQVALAAFRLGSENPNRLAGLEVNSGRGNPLYPSFRQYEVGSDWQPTSPLTRGAAARQIAELLFANRTTVGQAR